MKLLVVSILIACAFVSCKKSSSAVYPDCLDGVSATHNGQNTYWNAVYVPLSDTSCLIFGLNEIELDLEPACSSIPMSALNGSSSVVYGEWSLYPDSIPPDPTSDVLYPNTSALRQWELTSGNITATTSIDMDDYVSGEFFQISISLENAIFDRSVSGLSNVTFNQVVVKDVSKLRFI